MSRSFEITRQKAGGNVISIDVTVRDDGGLQILDLSYGPVADQVYGEGRDVEHWIDIAPEPTRQLSVKLFRDWVDDPAGDVARHLADRFRGDTDAIKKTMQLLDELGVPYDEELWT